jgi:hypothetical protein
MAVVQARRQTPQTDSSTSVMLARRVTGRGEEPGELDRDHLRGRRGWRGDVDDRDVPGGVGMPLGVHGLEGLAELGQAGGLAGARWPGQDQPAPANLGVPVEVLQPPPLDDHLLDGRGGDYQQFRVVRQPRLVIGEPLIVTERPPLCFGQQVGDFGALGDEGAPPGSAWSAAAPWRRSPCRHPCLAPRPRRRSPTLLRFGERVEDPQRNHLRQRRVAVIGRRLLRGLCRRRVVRLLSIVGLLIPRRRRLRRVRRR